MPCGHRGAVSMSQYQFISDLHLCDARPATVELFLKYLQTTAIEADRLYILGDLFDAWVGDDDDSKTAALVCNGLKQTSETGTNIYIMHGNRDFLIGKDFCQSCGATLLDDPTIIDINGQSVLLTHGDQLCTRDVTYQEGRKMRLQPEWLAQFLKKPLEERKAIAAEYRKQSGEAKSLLADDIMDVTPAEVIRWFESYQADMMIHGHTHRPATHHHLVQGSQKPRIVLPEWHENKAAAILVDDSLNITQMEIC